MIALATVWALFALWLLGAAVLSLLGAREERAPSSVSAEFAAGVSVLACVGMTTIAAGARLSLPVLYLLVAGAVALAIGRGGLRPVRPRLPAGRTARVLCAAAALVVAAVLTGAMQDRLLWDGWGIWAFKARVLFVEGTLPPEFMDPTGIYFGTNLDYPLAVPLLDWWLYSHAGEALPALASFAGAVWFALLPLLVWTGLRDRVDPRLAAGATLGTAAFWPVAYFATGGTADVVVALALLGAAVEMERAIRGGGWSPLVRAVTFLALGALAKNEGIALAAAAAVIAVAVLLLRGERRPLRLLPLLVPLLAVAPWLAFTRTRGAEAGALAAGESPGAAIDRLPLFLDGVRILFSSGPWLWVTPLVGVGLLALARHREPGLLAAWGVVAGYLLAVCAVYLRVPTDLLWLLATSLPRVLGAVVPALVYLTVLSVAGAGREEPLAARSALPAAA